jgi:hypothetical protein
MTVQLPTAQDIVTALAPYFTQLNNSIKALAGSGAVTGGGGSTGGGLTATQAQQLATAATDAAQAVQMLTSVQAGITAASQALTTITTTLAGIDNDVKAVAPGLTTQLTQIDNDVKAAQAALAAAIAAISTNPPSPPPPPPPPPPSTSFYPASGTDAQYMPPIPPASTPSSGAPELPNGQGVSSPTTIAAGTFSGVIDLANETTVTGAGIGQTIITALGLRPLYNKAVVVVEGAAGGGPSTTSGGGTVSSMTLTGAANSSADGSNAAGVCNGNLGYNMTIENVEIYGNNEGIRGLGGNVTITNCHVHHNGSDSPNGNTHNVYLNTIASPQGSDNSLVTVTNSKFEKSLLAHEFKSRLKSHVVTGSTFISTPIPGSQGNYATGPASQLGGNGSCVDLPNGSDWKGSGNTFVKGAGATDMNFITFGTEGLWPGYSGQMHEDSPVFDNQSGKTCYIVVAAGCTVTLNNPTFKGGQPTFQGNVVVTGTPVIQ